MSQFKYKIISQTLRSRNNQLFNPEISILHMVFPRSLKNPFPKQSCQQIFAVIILNRQTSSYYSGSNEAGLGAEQYILV